MSRRSTPGGGAGEPAEESVRVADGEGGAARLKTAPLLPTGEDRKLAREVEEVASEHLPERWVRWSNERGVVRVSRWPVLAQ